MSDVAVVPVQLQIRDSSRKPVPAELSVERLATGERVGRVGKVVGIGLLAVLVVAFVPLVHLFAPPLMLIVTAVVAILVSRKSVRVITPAVGCPKCGAATPVHPGSLGWPVTLDCPSCGATFRARPVEPATP